MQLWRIWQRACAPATRGTSARQRQCCGGCWRQQTRPAPPSWWAQLNDLPWETLCTYHVHVCATSSPGWHVPSHLATGAAALSARVESGTQRHMTLSDESRILRSQEPFDGELEVATELAVCRLLLGDMAGAEVNPPFERTPPYDSRHTCLLIAVGNLPCRWVGVAIARLLSVRPVRFWCMQVALHLRPGGSGPPPDPDLLAFVQVSACCAVLCCAMPKQRFQPLLRHEGLSRRFDQPGCLQLAGWRSLQSSAGGGTLT